jgi:hypothetical protein
LLIHFSLPTKQISPGGRGLPCQYTADPYL